ncbi:hypothetical protein VM1G_11355 [Cytospora mali]|uniref:Uncharacterized protein n=1 Tax=Cytospora mali TaxID=578113 RepID=A0A194VK18_CYTMA|nr:hypothetical protein VM1G_11355 [Valsa mali]
MVNLQGPDSLGELEDEDPFRLQLELQQLGGRQDGQQIGVGDDASINEASYSLNQISMQQWQVTPMGASYATAYGQPSSTNHQQQVNDDFQ